MSTFDVFIMLAIVDTLIAKTRAWEQEHGTPFTYDGVLLLEMLDEYKNLRQEKEEERRRMRVFTFFQLCNSVACMTGS